MAHSDPYLSVVVTSRNDDHGESLLRRMQTFVNALIGQCKRHGLQAELVLVEWNPPPGRPRFIEALRWPEKTDPCQVRIIEVPPELHQRFKHSENLPLFQMIAKNVGIRRARGRFVLATNIDILLSDELVLALARGELHRGRMYRINRHDVMTDVPVFADVAEQLRYCETHLLRINCREGTFELTPDGRRTVAPDDIATAGMDVSFEKGWYPVERWHGEVYRWVGQDAVLVVPVPADPARPLCLEIEPGPGVGNGPFELQVRDTSGSIVARGLVECRQRIYLTMPLRAGQPERLQLHTVGGGLPVSLDPRILNFRVMKCCWANETAEPAMEQTQPEAFHFWAEDAYVLATEDIATPEMGLRFGRGWHGFELWEGEPFRWVGDDAALAITLPSASAPILSLEVEPGPGVENRPFGLQVRDASGRTVARGFVQGRQIVCLTLPLSPGQTDYFQLHTEGGGRPIPNSPRILNFRVLRCAWVDASQIVASEAQPAGTFHFLPGDVFQLAQNDIAAADMGLRFGRGWYAVECNNGVLSRWAGDNASIAVEPPAGSGPVLSLELQPGPGVDHRVCTLQVHDRAGRTVAQGVVIGREVLHLLLPLRPGQTEHFRLHVPGGGRRIPSDPRILNFNVLCCSWSKNWGKINALAQPDDAFNFKTEDVYALADKDIAPADMGLRFGRSWYPVELHHGILYRWVGDEAGIAIDPPGGPANILSLELQPGPGVDLGAFTLQVQDRAGRQVAQGVVGGREIVHLQLPLRPGQTEYFRLRVPGGGRHIPSDVRVLNFSVLRCFWSKNWEAIQALPQPDDAHHLKTEDVYMLSEVDIASPQIGLRFGRGWYPTEQTNDVPYRWAGEDAALAMEAREGVDWVLNLEVQPGPGVGQQPFTLRVNDVNGRAVAQGVVDGRTVVHLLLPLRPGQGERFWLRAEGGGKRIATDARILDFRVSHCYWSQDWEAIPLSSQPATAFNFKTEDPYELAEEEIASAEMGLRFGHGWYPVERNHEGLYRWVGENAAFAVDAPAGPARVLSLEVQPGPGVDYRPFTLQVFDAGGRTVAQGYVANRKMLHLLLPLRSGQINRFRLHAQEGGRRIATDARILNFAVFHCSWSEDWEALADVSQPADAFNLKTEDRYVLAAEDIASADVGLRFGPGWHAVEHDQGRSWRWVGDNASLAVDAPLGPARALCLEVAPGPGVDHRPFVLQVHDANGQAVARVSVEGRKVVNLHLPLRPGQTARFRFHAEGGGRRIAADPRIMNFAVCRCFWSQERPADPPPAEAIEANWYGAEDASLPEEDDIVPRDMGLRFGSGWYAVQSADGELYRWAGDGAAIALTSPRGPGQALSLELEPGPGVGYRPFRLQVRDLSGQTVAREEIKGRQVIHLTLPVPPGHTSRFQLHVEEGNRLPGVARAFRILKCGWSKKPNGSPTARRLPLGAEGALVPAEHDIAPAEMGLRFGAGWSDLEQENGESYRWVENGATFTIQEMSDTPVKTLSLDLEPGPGLAKRQLEVQVRDPNGRIMAQEAIEGRQLAHLMLRVRPGNVERLQIHVKAGGPQGSGEPHGPVLRIFRCRWSMPGATVPDHEIISPLPLHTCACGDFTLLSREDWFELQGYAEFEMFSLHIDSVFCYMAHHHGVIEEMLEDPMRVYHIEHGKGSGWTPEGADKLMERIAAKGIACLECQEVLAWATDMRRLNRPMVLNYEDWGMANDVLPETVLVETAHESHTVAAGTEPRAR